MPNTLVHFAAQGAASHTLWRRLDPRWIYLGCLLPDLPWILRRAVVGFGLLVDPFDLRLYTMAQASLAGTLLLCAALALLTAAPRLAFSVLGLNTLFHLLLDATEVKWGNGVHLLAPLSWRMTRFDLVVGESPVVLAVTIAGALLVAWEIARPHRATLGLDLRPARLAAAGALLTAYFFAPLAVLGAIQASDSYSVKTLREVDARPGRAVGLDRTAFVATPSGGLVQLWTGERVRAAGTLPAHDATVSLYGTFLAPDLLRVDRLVEHRQHRDWPSTWRFFCWPSYGRAPWCTRDACRRKSAPPFAEGTEGPRGAERERDGVETDDAEPSSRSRPRKALTLAVLHYPARARCAKKVRS